MPPLDELMGHIAVAKGDVSASGREREAARVWYRFFLDELTRQGQQECPGDLSLTHESVEAAVEEAYREYRRRKEQAATRRLLQDGD